MNNKNFTSLFYFSIFIFDFSFLIAQPVNPSLFNCMQWRMIGPYRGGRTVGACGVRSQPNVFYIGVNDGGVWKTNDFGRTWNPVFDEQSTGSIGDVSVAQSNPNVIYAGSGEGLQRPDLSVGNGIYKSTDAGKTWTNLGLAEGMQVGGIMVQIQRGVFIALQMGEKPGLKYYISTKILELCR
jgi:hypothetical protein